MMDAMDPTLFDSIGDWNLFNPYQPPYQTTRVPTDPGYAGDEVNVGMLGALGGGGDPNAGDDIDAGGGWSPAQKTAVDHAQAFLRLAGMTSTNPLLAAQPMPHSSAAASTNRHMPPAYGAGHPGRVTPFGFGLQDYRKHHFGGSFL